MHTHLRRLEWGDEYGWWGRSRWRPVCSWGAASDRQCRLPEHQDSRADDLVGEAAAALDATGHFTLPTPIRRTTYPEISADRAGALAVAYIGDYGHFLLPHFGMKHGGPIDLASLRACGSPLYAATPYNAASLAQASVPTRRLLGPYWLVSLCAASGGQVLSIAVSALATNEQLTSGPIRLPHPASLASFPRRFRQAFRGCRSPRNRPPRWPHARRAVGSPRSQSSSCGDGHLPHNWPNGRSHSSPRYALAASKAALRPSRKASTLDS